MYLYQLQIVQIVKCRVITVKVERRRKRFVVDAVKLCKCKCKMFFFCRISKNICQNNLMYLSNCKISFVKMYCYHSQGWERRKKRLVVVAVKFISVNAKCICLSHLQNDFSKLPNVFVQLKIVICEMYCYHSQGWAQEEKACCGCSCSQSQIAAKSKEGKLSAVHKNVGKLINGNVLYFCANYDRKLYFFFYIAYSFLKYKTSATAHSGARQWPKKLWFPPVNEQQPKFKILENQLWACMKFKLRSTIWAF